MLLAGLSEGGVSLSSSFPAVDADDTAVALLLLSELGDTVDASVLQRFVTDDGHFASFPFERHPSIGVNAHVLHALVKASGYPGVGPAVTRLVEYMAELQLADGSWLDKWHVSPAYATCHALCVLAALPEPWASRTRGMLEAGANWMRSAQDLGGAWGCLGGPTLEETAYGLLALTRIDSRSGDLRHLAARRAAFEYLEEATRSEPGRGPDYPPLWIDKCLYTPPRVVESAIIAAGLANAATFSRAVRH
jgi:halimadienyl-diphosphate synthase